MALCQACGGTTIWIDEVSSDVCEQCGTLADSSQFVLESHIETMASTSQRDILPWVKGPAILKSSRAGKGAWTVSGQNHKAIRASREEMLMRETMQILTSKLNCPREFNRSFLLFTQAMSTGSFRWGNKAVCVAGICISLALREAKRPDSLRDIAYELSLRYLDVTYRSLSRTYHSVISALGLESSPADPASFLAPLRSHIETLLFNPPSRTTGSLVKTLRKTSLPVTVDMAFSLCSLLSALPENHELKNLPAGPTACAVFLHAMEGTSRSELPGLGSIAHFLGSKWGFSQTSVQSRYRSIQDELVLEIDRTPGLDDDNRSKRRKVARNLNEVLQYRDLLIGDTSKRRREGDDEKEAGPALKKRILSQSATVARQFLLNPLANPITSASRLYRRTREQAPPLSHTLMARPGSTLPPTRLQMLSLERGGSTEDKVPDSELFADGELDMMFRSPDQMRVVMGMEVYKDWEEAHEKAMVEETEDVGDSANPTQNRWLDDQGLFVLSDKDDVEPELVLYPDLQLSDEVTFSNEQGFSWEDGCYIDDYPVAYQDQE